MADNVSITPGSGDTVLADQLTDATLGTGKAQFVKVMDGTLDSSNKLIVSSAGAAKVDGSGVTQPVSISGTIPISGSVSVSNFPGTQAVSGTFFQATQPVSLATAPTTTVIQPTGTNLHVVVDSAPSTAITGTVTANAGTNLNTSLLALESGGNLASVNTKTPALGQALATASVPVVLTAAQLTTLTPLSSISVSNFPVTQPISGTVAVSSLPSIPAGANAIGSVSISNFPVTQPVSGTVTANAGTGSFTVVQTTAANLNATVTGAVSVSNFPATQPVSGTVAISGTVPVSLATAPTTTVVQPTGTNLHVVVDAVPTTAVTGTFFQSTQPISVTTLPLPTGAATSAKQPAIGTAGTPSVDIVTIQGATSMTKLLVTPDSVALPANQSINLNQVGGAAITLGSKVSASSTPVVIASDQAAISVAQSGIWTVQPGNTPNTTPWLVETRSESIPSYAATIIGLVPLAAGATDLFTITGSATKIIKVLALHIAGNATTATTVSTSLVKRSTANTGGTSSVPTTVPHDSNNAAGTATVLAYTANPTALGASVGMLDAFRLDLPTVASATNGQLDENFDDGQPFTLRGTSQVLAINFNSTAIAGGSVNISIHWTEE